ncbi:MAG: hypothetical protein O7C67_14885 [Gammaproteobacteria bacterium]|nr:hypothetical protein [Gammaproteobacteria bacterium]
MQLVTAVVTALAMWLVTVEEAAAALQAGVVCILPTAGFAWLSTRNVRAAQFVGLGVLKSFVTMASLAVVFVVAKPAPLGFFAALIALQLAYVIGPLLKKRAGARARN